jgi:hypothetical protein
MKKRILSVLLVAALFSTSDLKAQMSDLYSFMDQYLSNDERDRITRAKSNFEKGKKLDADIQAEDSKTEKYFAKKAKKGEKKSVEAKTLRIKQGLNYESAYSLVYNVYADKVGSASFIYEEDESKVNRMIEEASAESADAARKIKPYKTVSPKDLKSNVVYSKLRNDLQNMVNSYESAIKKLIEAYTIVVDQEQKKQLEEEEERVWQNALSENSILSFQNYLSEYPNGKYAQQAKSNIADLEAIAKKEQADLKKRSLAGNLLFQVQIAASRVKLSKARLAQIYKAANEIEEKFQDNWYKYSVGSFKTYDEARAFRDKTRVRGAFVIVFRDGKKIDITEVVSPK